MADQKLYQFETKLRRLIEDRPDVRPFVCEGSPLNCTVFLVGSNPATDLGKPFWSHWNVGKGFNKAQWFKDYECSRRSTFKAG